MQNEMNGHAVPFCTLHSSFCIQSKPPWCCPRQAEFWRLCYTGWCAAYLSGECKMQSAEWGHSSLSLSHRSIRQSETQGHENNCHLTEKSGPGEFCIMHYAFCT